MRRRDAHKQFARTSLKHNVKNSEAFTIASLSKNNIKLGPSSQKYRKSLHVFAATSKQARTTAASERTNAQYVYRKQFPQYRWPLPSSERDLPKVANNINKIIFTKFRKRKAKKSARIYGSLSLSNIIIYIWRSESSAVLIARFYWLSFVQLYKLPFACVIKHPNLQMKKVYF